MNKIDVTSAGALVGMNGIFAGNESCICGESSFSGIGGGGKNMVECGYASYIGGGDWNCIYPSPGGSYRLYRSFIGGGFQNCIESNNSVIAGGINNSILTNSADASVIAGGTNNVVSGSCSAVLGGSGNSVTHSYAAVFGNALASCAADTFHVSCLNAVNTPGPGGAGLPAGTIFYDNVTIPGYGPAKLLMIV